MSDGQAEAKALAEYLAAPVVASYLHNDAFPASHPLMCGPLGYQGSKAAMKVIAQADVVLALGTRLGPFGTLPQHGLDYWPKQAKIVQVDPDHRVLGLVKSIAVGVCGDAKAAAADILHRLQTLNRPIAGHANKEARQAEVKKQKEAWESELNQWGQGGGSPIPPRRALRELEKAMPKNAMVTTDIGNICSVSNSYLRFERPRSFFAAMSFGNCGYAFPTAIGAKVAAPDRPAVAYVGDGAWGMSLQETLTCVRENIPVTAVVFNNGQWGAEKKNQIDYYADRFVGTNLENPSFAAIARAMGAEGIAVEAPDQVGDAIKKAAASAKPTVIEIKVTQELGDPFRRDALKKPVRLLDKYKAYSVA
jgi:sulfoacetaldehyde acetyltransferase